MSLLLLSIMIVGCGQVTNSTLDNNGGESSGTSYSATSPWDAAQAVGSHAVIVAANWTDPVGSIATIDLADPLTAKTALITTDGSDAVIQSFGGRIYVLNRFGTDTVQVIDPSGFSVIGNYSVGAGSNPQDIYVRSDQKAYLTRLDAQNDTENGDDLFIINPLTGELISSIDLKPYTADDGERLARAGQMVAVDDKLYVIIQDLPASLMDPADNPGRIVVIDMLTDMVVDVIVLTGRNPSDITYSPTSDKLYISDTGVFNNFVADTSDSYGGVEVVDPVTMESEGIVVDDAELGGYVFHIRLGEDRGYTVVDGYKVASFSLDGFEVISNNMYESAGFFVPDIAVDSEGRLLVTERDATNAGIAILDGITGDLLHGPIDVGAMPAAITFVDIN